jgi:hypothetical protein
MGGLSANAFRIRQRVRANRYLTAVAWRRTVTARAGGENKEAAMFVQFIEGSVADTEGFRRQLERWQETCAQGAHGWLGTTAGVSADGTAFLCARFDSVDAARRNSDRPEQSGWWAETEKHFDGPASFADCDEVELMRDGGSDDAGFVQVIRGRVNDLEAARALFSEDMPDDVRPDVLGGLTGTSPDGSYTSVVYFTSEAEARAAESTDNELAEQMMALHDEPPRYLDLPDPWLWSP